MGEKNTKWKKKKKYNWKKNTKWVEKNTKIDTLNPDPEKILYFFFRQVWEKKYVHHMHTSVKNDIFSKSSLYLIWCRQNFDNKFLLYENNFSPLRMLLQCIYSTKIEKVYVDFGGLHPSEMQESRRVHHSEKTVWSGAPLRHLFTEHNSQKNPHFDTRDHYITFIHAQFLLKTIKRYHLLFFSAQLNMFEVNIVRGFQEESQFFFLHSISDLINAHRGF